MLRMLTVMIALLIALPSYAGGIAVVDFQRAVNETKEGKQAQAKLDAMYEQKKAEIAQMKTALEQSYKDYQSRQMILSNDARASAERELLEAQQAFEATYMQYQNEMQQNYMAMLQGLDKKMRSLTQKLGKEGSYDLVIDKAVVVYAGGQTKDITDLLISRYNAQ